jgi:hypothetical protein
MQGATCPLLLILGDLLIVMRLFPSNTLLSRSLLFCVYALLGIVIVACTPTDVASDITSNNDISDVATSTDVPTLVPTATTFIMPTAEPSLTPIPTTPTATSVQIDPLLGVEQAPPYSLTLPESWQFAYDTLVLEELGELVYQPFAVYQGDVTNGRGTIVVLWDYRSVTTGNPLSPDYGNADGWIDGLRLLRTVVLENTCNFGTAPRRDDYTVGGLPAVGTQFSAVDCPELPDTRGWFAALTANDTKYIFYMYTEPINAMDGQAPFDMQAILDSITFE